MAQTTTSQLAVSLGPPRPLSSVIFSAPYLPSPWTASCITTTFSGYTGCIATPSCSALPTLSHSWSITHDISGTLLLVCANTLLSSVATVTASSTSINPTGSASTSLPLTSLPTTSTTPTISTTTSTPNAETPGSSGSNSGSAAATASTTSGAVRKVAAHMGLPGYILLPWVGLLTWSFIFSGTC